MQWREDVCSYKSSQTVPVCASELPQLLCLTEGVIWMNIRLFCGWFWAAPVCLYINFSIRWWGATWWCYMTITSDPRLNLKTIASVCNSTAANPTPDCFDELYCFVGLFLLFAWFSCEIHWVTALVASEEEVFLPERRQDVRFSASSASCVTDRSV